MKIISFGEKVKTITQSRQTIGLVFSTGTHGNTMKNGNNGITVALVRKSQFNT